MTISTVYERRVLVAVVGLSPQTVTETLYALHARSGGRETPNELHVITTAEGAKLTRLALLPKYQGWLEKLRRDYNLPPINFSKNSIHVVLGSHGAALDDIRTPEDNNAAADFIASIVRDLASEPDCSLHLSIAGGRKTMSFYLGYALILYGRSQDRLSHVLVSAPFESIPEFFYPPPVTKAIQQADGRTLDASLAEVTLADVPLVSIRRFLPADALSTDSRFGDLVGKAKTAIEPLVLEIDIQRHEIKAASKRFRLPPSQLALLLVFARRRLIDDKPVSAPSKEAPDKEWARAYISERRALASENADISRAELAYRNGMSGDDFSSLLSKLHRSLRRELGPSATGYLINDGNCRPRRYSLDIAPQNIRFVSFDDINDPD